MKKALFTICFLSSCLPLFGYAATIVTPSLQLPILKAPRIPRLNLETLVGSSTPYARADLMTPVFSRTDRVLYADFEGRYNAPKENYSTNLGFGYRQVINANAMGGVYVFGDRSVSSRKKVFWVLNPGIEFLTNTWDFRANGYIPVGKKRWTISEDWADNFGYYNAITLHGNTMYDNKVRVYGQVGYGADAEIGRTIPFLKNLRGYAGIYHYGYDNGHIPAIETLQKVKNITGGSFRLDYAHYKHLTVELKDSYDNFFHNTFMVGVMISFGGTIDDGMDRSTINARLLEPVVHNIGAINRGTIEPIQKRPKTIEQGAVELDHIIFIGGSASTNEIGDGSYEHPYSKSQLNNYLLEHIKTKQFSDYSNIFLQQGTGYSNARDLHILSGQNIRGRSIDYKKNALGELRPLIYGQMKLEGSNIVSHIRLQNSNASNAASGVGISAVGAAVKAINIDNVKIDVDTDYNNSANYSTGITVEDGAQVDNIDFSTIFAANPTSNRLAIGINIEKQGKVGYVANNSILVNATGIDLGVYIRNSTVGTITGNTIISKGITSAYGVAIGGNAGKTVVDNIIDNPLIKTVVTGNQCNYISSAIYVTSSGNPGGTPADIRIGNVSGNSDVEANGTQAVSFLIFNRQAGSKINIGNISNNIMKSVTNFDNSYGIYLQSYTTGTTSIGSIDNNTMTNIGPGSVSMVFKGSGILVKGISDNILTASQYGIWNSDNDAVIGNFGTIVRDNQINAPTQYWTGTL